MNFPHRNGGYSLCQAVGEIRASRMIPLCGLFPGRKNPKTLAHTKLLPTTVSEPDLGQNVISLYPERCNHIDFKGLGEKK